MRGGIKRIFTTAGTAACGKSGVDTKEARADETEDRRMQQPQKDKTKAEQQHGTAGAAATPRTKTNPKTAEGKPVGGVETHRTGEKQRQYRKTKTRLKKRCGTRRGLERAQQ